MVDKATTITLAVVIPLVVIVLVVIIVYVSRKYIKFYRFRKKKNFQEVSFRDNPVMTGKLPDTPRNSAIVDVELGNHNDGYVTSSMEDDENETSFTCNIQPKTQSAGMHIERVVYDSITNNQEEHCGKTVNASENVEINVNDRTVEQELIADKSCGKLVTAEVIKDEKAISDEKKDQEFTSKQHTVDDEVSCQQVDAKQTVNDDICDEQDNVKISVSDEDLVSCENVNTEIPVNDDVSGKQVNSKQPVNDDTSGQQVNATITVNTDMSGQEGNSKQPVNDDMSSQQVDSKQTVKDATSGQQADSKQTVKDATSGQQFNSTQTVNDEVSAKQVDSKQTVDDNDMSVQQAKLDQTTTNEATEKTINIEHTVTESNNILLKKSEIDHEQITNNDNSTRFHDLKMDKTIVKASGNQDYEINDDQLSASASEDDAVVDSPKSYIDDKDMHDIPL
ncbi:Hypothetical predicted protein [Mytilus galloprovincialis]|uniref:Uncharacterized protein n=1 Tax=Mytilus galloprovincialis TaxID=29158 RepID=A0A8B6BKD5_MYTGA|nr:Hypothetical predicted protein [Mytilus galloprovincialis]VDH92158.1 Hypothetical predicted protein [Mytilus galloprovincialis]